MYHIIQRR